MEQAGRHQTHVGSRLVVEVVPVKQLVEHHLVDEGSSSDTKQCTRPLRSSLGPGKPVGLGAWQAAHRTRVSISHISLSLLAIGYQDQQ